MSDEHTKLNGKIGLQEIQEYVNKRTGRPNHFENVFKGIKVLSGGDGNILCEFEMKEEHRNSHGTMHGGLIATLVDSVSTWGLHTYITDRRTASVDISIAYMKPPRVGQKILIDAKTLKAGRRMAFMTVDIKTEDGTLCARGKHTKIILDLGAKL